MPTRQWFICAVVSWRETSCDAPAFQYQVGLALPLPLDNLSPHGLAWQYSFEMWHITRLSLALTDLLSQKKCASFLLYIT